MNRAPTAATARIGPNAIVQLAHALRSADGDAAVRRLFGQAGLDRYLQRFPDRMVDEEEVIRLHHALARQLPPVDAARVARDAGLRTGDYLLAHRIPVPVRRLLPALPATLAARLLLQAIGRHAWTFAGSGRFSAAPLPAPTLLGGRWRLEIADNPLCRGLAPRARPACDYYAATFERLFVALVHRRARVVETACEARGDPACRFEVRWP